MKPEWVSQLKNARDSDRIREGMAWRVTMAHYPDFDVDLGQFGDGVWFCGPCAGDSASEAIARHYMGKCKSYLDDIDDAAHGVRAGSRVVFGVDMEGDLSMLLHWYMTAKRAELKEGK